MFQRVAGYYRGNGERTREQNGWNAANEFSQLACNLSLLPLNTREETSIVWNQFNLNCGGVDQRCDIMNFGASDLDLNPDWTFVDPCNRTQCRSFSQHVFLLAAAAHCSGPREPWTTPSLERWRDAPLICFAQIHSGITQTAARLCRRYVFLSCGLSYEVGVGKKKRTFWAIQK